MKRLAALIMLGGCAQVLGLDDVVPSDQCSPFDVDTCELDETCDVWEAEVLTCRPEGGLPVNAQCDQGIDTCRGPLSCIDGLCRTICGPERACDPADNESECSHWYNDSMTVCDSDCNVLDGTGCVNDVDQQCVPLINAFDEIIPICTYAGYFGDLPEDAGCDYLNQCGRGLGCDPFDARCRPLCDADAPVCSNGGTCVMLGRVHESLSLGVCRLE